MPIESQKQSRPGSAQSTTMMKVALTASRVVTVDVAAAGEHAILDSDCGQVAAADSEERERLLRRRLFLDLRDLAVQPRAPQPHTRAAAGTASTSAARR